MYGIRHPFETALYSDSISIAILIGDILLITFTATLIWQAAMRTKSGKSVLTGLILFCRYYLASALLIYGFNKVFKQQFYLPEPNTLYTTIGQIPRDLLYWSAMGSSRAYSLFLGSAEVMAAALLLFRRTAKAGAWMSAAILLNVLAVNLSFDVSVKLLSGYLVLLCMVLIAGRKSIRISFLPFFSRIFYPIFKWGLTLWIIADALYPYLQSGNYNDDETLRPPLHGAWEVQTFIHNGDTLPLQLNDSYRWRRFFIHSKGYFIVQDMQDKMQDFELFVDTAQRTITIENQADSTTISLLYEPHGEAVQLWGWWTHTDSISVNAQKLPEDSLPLLQNEFHFLE